MFASLQGQEVLHDVCAKYDSLKMNPNDRLSCVLNYCKNNTQKKTNEVKEILEEVKLFINQHKLNSRIGEYYYYYGNLLLEIESYDSAEFYYTKSLNLIADRNLELLYQLNLRLGISKRRQIQFHESLRLFNKAMQLAVQAKDELLIAKTYNEIGTLYTEQQEYSEAISNFQLAINSFREKRDTLSVARVYTNIAGLYRRTGNNPLAMDYLQKSHKIYKKLKNPEGLALAYKNMGMVYESMTNYSQAEEQFMKAKQIYEEINYQLYIAIVYNSLGNTKLQLDKIEESMTCFTQSLNIFSRLNDKIGQITVLKDIGILYFKEGDQTEARNYFFKSLKISNSLNNPVFKLEIYKLLSESFSKSQNFQKAFEYRLKYEKAYHENLIREKNREYILLKSKLKQKEDEVVLVKEQFIETKTNLNEEIKFYKGLLIGLIFLCLTIIITLYLRNVRSIKVKGVIIDKKTKLIQQQDERIKIGSAKIEELIKTKDKFFAITTKNIIEPVETLRLLINKLAKDTADKDKILLDFIYTNKDGLTMAYNLIDNILYWARNQQQKVVYEPNYHNLEELVYKTVAFQKMRADAKKIEINVKGVEQFEGYFDYKMIEIALRNFIENAIKFSTWGGAVDIVGSKSDDKLILKIIDLGVGMTKEQISKLSVNEKIEAAVGTHGEKGGGIGFILANEFVKRNFGSVKVKSSIALGTTVTIYLPSSNKNRT